MTNSDIIPLAAAELEGEQQIKNNYNSSSSWAPALNNDSWATALSSPSNSPSLVYASFNPRPDQVQHSSSSAPAVLLPLGAVIGLALAPCSAMGAL
ncbi:unnamed protein product, partial [Amoebophrya sp. A25]|eukprot:GSA25T00019984001.1